jgi:ribosomal protein S18 acetylase RimI-like enzyme
MGARAVAMPPVGGGDVIEELGAGDARAAVLLWDEAGLTRPWNNPREDFLKAVNGSTSAVLGLREDGLLVGSAMVGFDGHRGWVYYLSVTRTFRGRGYGRRLMSAAEAWLRARGARKIQFMVRRENDEVIEFYSRLGYVPQYVQVMGRRLD